MAEKRTPAKTRTKPKSTISVAARRSNGVTSIALAGVAEKIERSANDHIVRHYPIGCVGGTPRPLTLGSQELWIVPIVLTSPGYGAVGEVGVVALEARTHKVVGSTPRLEVGAAVNRLREGKHDELEAAFCRARTS